MKSPGRRTMAQELRGKRHVDAPYYMRGADIPEAVECDKQFFQLFQISKRLEKTLHELREETIPDIGAIKAAQDAFNEALNAVRFRWLQLVPEDRPS